MTLPSAHKHYVIYASVLTACSSKKGAAALDASEAAATATDTEEDQENEPANQPAMVAGAFLTGVGLATGAPGAPADTSTAVSLTDGSVVYGAGLFAASTKTKYLGSLSNVYVDLVDANFNVTHPALTDAPADSPWDVYFELPAGAISSYVAVVFAADYVAPTGDEEPADTSTTSAYTFTPAPLTTSELAASQPVTVDATPPVDDGVGAALKAAAAGQTASGALPTLVIAPGPAKDLATATITPLPAAAPTLVTPLVAAITTTATGPSTGLATTLGVTGTIASIGSIGTSLSTALATATATASSILSTASSGTASSSMTASMTSTGTVGMGTGSPSMTMTATTTSASTGIGSESPSMTMTTTDTNVSIGSESPMVAD